MCRDVPNTSNPRVNFVVDCQTLADMVNVEVPISSPNYAPICERMTNNLCICIDKGMKLWDIAKPVEWRPRFLNKLADSLANKAMDETMDLDWDACRRGSWKGKNLTVFSDGGFRGRCECAAAAWVVVEAVGTVHGARDVRVIAKGSKCIADCSSSFMAEAIALEMAINAVVIRMEEGPMTTHGIPMDHSVHEYRKNLRIF